MDEQKPPALPDPAHTPGPSLHLANLVGSRTARHVGPPWLEAI